ncbi:MAG: GNAT family N-acetyltransferase [Gammaproteobacteria bacterium]
MRDTLASALADGIALRAETAADWEFVVSLYAATRAAEMAPVHWPQGALQAFLRCQCELQRAHYRTHYEGADFWVLEREAGPIGRLYLHVRPAEIRIMDIALLPAECGRGLGTRLLKALLGHAQSQQASVTLHVEPLNPAQRLYRRLGFRLNEDRGVYHFLEWRYYPAWIGSR